MRNFLLGSGMYAQQADFGKIWAMQASRANAPMRAIVQVGDMEPRPWLGDWNVVLLRGNPGHVHDLIPGMGRGKPHSFCGWSSSVMALAWLAYCNESDFVYLEEDCLAFGQWVEQMYSDLGSGKMVFGRRMKSAPWMPCAQSLFLIKHDFIPDFVQTYLSLGKDGDIHNLPEHKFCAIESKFGAGVIKRLSFGYDRERPINFDDRVWYAQKFSNSELDELRRRGMV